MHGACRYEIEDNEASGMLAPGDLLVLLHDRRHILHDGSAARTLPFETRFNSDNSHGSHSAARDGTMAAKLICGRFQFDKQVMGALLALLPPHIHLQGVDGRAAPWLAETLRHIMHESDPDRPGRLAIVDHLAQIIFIEAIRSCMHALPARNGRFLEGLMDPDIGPVLEIIHTRPELPWTVASLAEHVGMSRSVFASRFKEMLAKTPFQYLLECRMRKACSLLSEDRHGIKKIASLSGYATESAFTNAFKRWSGKTPGAYRRISVDGGESLDGMPDRRPHGSEKRAAVRQTPFPG